MPAIAEILQTWNMAPRRRPPPRAGLAEGARAHSAVYRRGVGAAGQRAALREREPGHQQAAGPGGAGGPPRTWTRRWRRRARRSRPGRGRRGMCAPATSTPSRARCRSTARLLRRARDAGQRQADPRDARHRHPAGGPPLLLPRRLGAADGRASCPACVPRRRRRPDHPLELPAADAGLEDRPGAGDGQHGGAQARRVHPAHRARLRRDLRTRSACRRAWSTSSPATARTGDADRQPPRRRQDRLHRLDRGRPHHPRGHRGQRQAPLAGAGRQVALHRLRRRRPGQRGRGRGGRHLVQPGPGLLRRARACWCRRASPNGSIAKLRARMETLRVGDPLDKAVDIGAIVAPVQLEKISRLVQQGVDEGATLWQPSWACPTEGCFYPPTLFTDVSPAPHHRPGRDLRPGAGRDDLPHARRSGRAGQQHAATAWPPASGARTSTWRSTWPARSRRAPSGSTAPTCSTPPPASAATARAASAARAASEGLYEYVQPAWEASDGGSDGRAARRTGRQTHSDGDRAEAANGERHTAMASRR